MNQHVLLLADPEGAVGRLVLDGRVPPAVEVDHVRSRRQVQPGAARFQRQHEERRAVFPLKLVDELLPLLDARPPVEHQPGSTEKRGEEPGQRVGDLAELRENEDLLLPGRDLLGDLRQPAKLAAPVGRVVVRAGHLGGMIANLLQPHQLGQDDPPPLDSITRLQLLGEVVDRFLVEGRLVLAQRAVGFHLRLIREIGDHPFVGLQPPQDVGSHKISQRFERRNRRRLATA